MFVLTLTTTKNMFVLTQRFF